MKNTLRTLVLIVALLGGTLVRSQSFTVSFPDTIAWGAAVDSSTLSCWIDDYVTNITENPITMDIVRVQNDTATPGWTSSFCFQFCSLPYVDSIRTTLLPNEAVNIALHFHVTGVPDSGSVLMKYQNVNNPSEVVYQRFYAFTSPTSAGPTLSDSAGQVTCFPSPIAGNQNFTMHLQGEKFAGKSMTLEVFDIYGRKVASETGLHEGSNALNLDLPAGMYTYTIKSGEEVVHTGKLMFSR